MRILVANDDGIQSEGLLILARWAKKLGDISKYLNETGKTLGETKLTPEKMTELIGYIEKNTISTASGKKIFEIIVAEDKPIKQLIDDMGLAQVSDTSELEALADKVLAENEPSVTSYKNGKTNALGYLVGQCMKASKGKANPGMMKEIILKKLGE